MPGGYSFDHINTLKTIDLYYNGKFKTGAFDSRGRRKFFFNVVKPPCDVATKFIDLDTKDVILHSDRSGDELKVWLMQRKLKQWMKDEGFGKILNQIAHDYPKYGHVVVKIVGDDVKKVNLHNIRLDPTVECMEDSSFVYELHVMSPKEIDDMGWDTTELYARGEDSEYLVYECYEKSGKKWKRTIQADVFAKQKGGKYTNRSVEALINEEADYAQPLTIHTDTVKELPYRELKWENVPGRWLGLGFVEYLEDNQIATNEAENLERKGLALSALQLLQTRDDSVGGSNILTDAENGDIIKSETEITPIATEQRNLAAFNATRGRWDQNGDRKTFSFDISRGENLPSRTPLGVANISAGMVTSYFELKREQFGIFVTELIREDVIPSFQNQNSKEHILTFLGSDEELDKLDKTIIDAYVGNAIMKHANKTGFFPSRAQVLDAKIRAQEVLKKQKNRYVKVPENYYRDAKYTIDVNTTGEQFDTGAMSQSINLALQTLSGNPAIMQNKGTRTLYFKLLSMAGLSPIDLNVVSDDLDANPLPQGGSLSQPGQGQVGTLPVTNQV